MPPRHRNRQGGSDHHNGSHATVAPLASERSAHVKDDGHHAEHTALVLNQSLRARARMAISMAVVGVALCVLFGTWLFAIDSSREQIEHGHSVNRETDAAAADDDASAAAFISWFQSQGGRLSDKISIGHVDGMGRGIVARVPLDEHDELLFVPLDVIICRETIWKRTSKKVLAKYEKLRDAPTELLTAFLLLEQFKDASSHWYPYLRILPSYPPEFGSVATPLFYESSESIQELQDERMVHAATLERRQAKIAFQRFRRLFKTMLPADSKVSDLLEKRYLWARFLINSRAFSIRGDRYLVPFGDVFNGKPQPNNNQRALSDGRGVHFLQYHRLHAGHGMQILADRAVTELREQVFEDYGDNDNYIYFLYHGFLMDENPFDCASVRLSPVPHSSVANKILQSYSRSEDDGRLVCITPQGSVRSSHDKQLVQLQASVMSMDEALARAVCSKRENLQLCTQYSTQTEEDDLLRASIHQQLNSFATTADEDLALLRDETTTQTLRHAVGFRRSRKQILESAFSALELKLRQRVVQHEIDQGELPPRDQSISERMQRFVEWIEKQNFPINHVELKYVSPAMGYGTYATKPLEQGEIYLSVPSDVVMDARSALRSPFIRELILAHRNTHGQLTESRLLLLHLLHEMFSPAHASRWRPYLDTLPDQGRLSSPLFFAADGPELRLLAEAVPYDLSELILHYRDRVDAEYDNMKSDLVDLPEWISMDRFRWANAILDSRSIWWSGTRHLVPLLDMVNCLELSEDHAPHATRLAASTDAAVTHASWQFSEGDQVVENYAQPNYIYLLYHGFVLSQNSHDCAHFHFELDLARQLPSHDVDRKVVIAILESMHMYSWSQDVCVGGSTSDTNLDKLLRLALIAASPQKAANAERGSTSAVITSDHVQAATRATVERVQRLEAAIATLRGDHETSGAVKTYIEQQHRLMHQVLSRLKRK